MKVIVLFKATPDSAAGGMPTEAILTAMGQINEELVKAGVMQAGEGLHPSSEGGGCSFQEKTARALMVPLPKLRSWWRASGSGKCRRWPTRSPGLSRAPFKMVRSKFGPFLKRRILAKLSPQSYFHQVGDLNYGQSIRSRYSANRRSALP